MSDREHAAKVHSADREGDRPLRIRVAAHPTLGHVLVQFGEPVAWLAFAPDEARALARSILEAADWIGPPGAVT
jgi:hypothetical protein